MYRIVREEVEKEFPNAQIEGIPLPGRTGKLEISVNDQLIHSKLRGDGKIDDMTSALNLLKKVRKVIRK